MLYPEEKERANRFKLALRMGLPVFALAVITVTSVLLRYFNHIPTSFVIIAFAMLGIMVYYLFYLIYQGFNERITDPVTQAFTREYFFSTMQKEIERKTYTFLMFSVENLEEINKQYGFVNGDMILRDVTKRLSNYFEEKGLHKIPIAYLKGGRFLVALEGPQDLHRTMMELMCIKFKHYSVDEIEVDLVASMSDSTHFKEMDRLVEWLYELQNEKRKTLSHLDEEIDHNTLEGLVVEAVEARRFSYRFQAAYHAGEAIMYEMAVKLLSDEGKLIHQKRFMPAVQRLGLLRRYDEIQVEAAIESLNKIDPNVKIAIDVAASTLRNPRFLEYVLMLFSNNEHLKDRLVFVFSEAMFYHQIVQFNAKLQAYRRAGICMALDRLGGLQTSLRYVQACDLDMVRYESFFGKEILDEKVQALLEGFEVSLKNLGLRSWIRMIETESQLEAAKKLNIDIVQGKYLSPIEALD